MCIKEQTEVTKHSEQEVKTQIILWKAVILQALIDLASTSKKRIAQSYRFQAMKWFSIKNQDYLLTCALAGLNPDYVLDKAKSIKRKSKFLAN